MRGEKKEEMPSIVFPVGMKCAFPAFPKIDLQGKPAGHCYGMCSWGAHDDSMCWEQVLQNQNPFASRSGIPLALGAEVGASHQLAPALRL